MRESFGGAFLLSISITFIIVFSSFLAISINYSKAFTVKNEIINAIEDGQGWRQTSSPNVNASCTDETTSTECQILKYLNKVGYNIKSTATKPVYCPEEYNDRYGRRKTINSGGYCIKRVCTRSGTGRLASGYNTGSAYYQVTTFVRIEVPILWVGLNVPVTGQTMTLYYDNARGIECSNT